MKTINFTPEAFAQYNQWRNENKRIQDKIVDLIEDILKFRSIESTKGN